MPGECWTVVLPVVVVLPAAVVLVPVLRRGPRRQLLVVAVSQLQTYESTWLMHLAYDYQEAE